MSDDTYRSGWENGYSDGCKEVAAYCGAAWKTTMEQPDGYWYSEELEDLRRLAHLLAGGVLASDPEVRRIVQTYKKEASS